MQWSRARVRTAAPARGTGMGAGLGLTLGLTAVLAVACSAPAVGGSAHAATGGRPAPAPAKPGTPSAKSATPAGKFTLAADEQAIVDLTNAERKKEGLAPLQINAQLFAAARSHTENMARQGVLEHTLDGKVPVDRTRAAGYPSPFVGENVAMGQRGPAAVVEGWMNSPGHRANILNKDYVEIGVAAVTLPGGRPYYTQVFGRPAKGPAPRPPAVTVKATLINGTGEPSTFQLGADAAKRMLKPDESRAYEVVGIGRLPVVKFTVGKDVHEFPLTDGGRFRITKGDDGKPVLVAEKE